ncbi:MAG: hypothetical protein ACPGF7_03570 [Pontibacterium sp.]
MKLRSVSYIFVLLVLSGCNATQVQSVPPEPAVSQLDIAPAKPGVKPIVAPVVEAKAEDKAETENVAQSIDVIGNRITAVQEQLLNIRSQNAIQLEQLQSVQVQLHAMVQDLKGTGLKPLSTEGAAQAQPSQQEFSLLLDQMARLANDVALQLQDGNYQFESCYTQTGQWILIRYNRFSGESWLADEGRWIALEEQAGPSASLYEVKLERADKDTKGFVAARMDRQSGKTWWLKQNIWQPLEP